MITYTALALGILALVVVSVRWWYLGLCGLALMTVLTNHPKMPSNIANIQGFNPWNMILVVVLLSWLRQHRREPTLPIVPGIAKVLFCAYVLLVLATTAAAVLDVQSLTGTVIQDWGRKDVFVDGMVNPLKYITIGVLYFAGACNRQRVRLALVTAVSSGFFYGLLMYKSMKLRVFTADFVDARRLTDKLVGLFANDLALVMAFSICGAVLIYVLFNRRWQRVLWLLGVATMLPPFVVLKSRAGFAAFGMIWLVLGTLRWRSILLLFPVAGVLTVAFVPSVQERALSGFGFGQHSAAEVDWDEVSAGRLTNIWPPVIEQIRKSPLIGFGRYAILREDCYWGILALEREVPTHPHNAYLEILVDAGAVGLAICLACAGGIIAVAVALLRVRGNVVVMQLGAVALVAAVGLLTAGVAGSTFYPTESFVPYLCVWGVALRVYSERRMRTRFVAPLVVNTVRDPARRKAAQSV